MTPHPYRANARPADDARPVPSASVAVGIACVVALVVAVFGYLRAPERVHAELYLRRVPFPTHPTFEAVSTDWSASRVIAVGKGGAVFFLNAADERWKILPSGVSEDLHAVAQGDGPHTRWWPDVLPGHANGRTFAVGARGTLVDCGDERCERIPTTTTNDLRAVAIGGGQAFAVGDHGTLLHLRPDGDARRRRRADALREKVEVVDVHVDANLRTVAIRCDDDADTCTVVATGDDGTTIEGRGVGGCDDGTTVSGSYSDCHWTWSSLRTPTATVAPTIASPVHLASGLLHLGRRKSVGAVALDPPAARVDGKDLPLQVRVPLVGGHGADGMAFFVGRDGELYVVR